MNKLGLLGAMGIGLSSITGCADGTGAVTFDTWGEEYIEDKLPVSEFEDGWEVTFDKFLINIGNVTVAGADGTTAVTMGETIVFDHKLPGVKPVFSALNITARTWEKVSFEVPVTAGDAALSDGVTEADRDLLVDAKASVYVVGSATKGAETKTFEWAFAVGTLYSDCKGERDGKETAGAVVTSGGTEQMQLTIHGDHLFYDDLQADSAVLRFDPIAAADADMDGAVTLAELSMVQLKDIPVGSYGTGSVDDVNDLGAFVIALSQTVGHFRGEGECFAKPLP